VRVDAPAHERGKVNPIAADAANHVADQVGGGYDPKLFAGGKLDWAGRGGLGRRFRDDGGAATGGSQQEHHGKRREDSSDTGVGHWLKLLSLLSYRPVP